MEHPIPIHAETGLAEGTFGVGTFSDDGRRFPALVKPDGGVVDLSGRFQDTHSIFDDWERNFDVLDELVTRSTRGAAGTQR